MIEDAKFGSNSSLTATPILTVMYIKQLGIFVI